MNSCLYKARVMHHRLSPRTHRFDYKVFLFCLDLEEIDLVSSKLRWLSHNRFNLFDFRDSDHLQLPALDSEASTTSGVPDPASIPSGAPNPASATCSPRPQGTDIRQHLTSWLQTQDVDIGKGRIMLLTNCRTFGHQFNPVSFYFCFTQEDEPLCAVAEVGNTFKELKPYLLGRQTLQGGVFREKIRKFFYVSPFIDVDTWFDFDLAIPDENLRIRIDDYDAEGNRFFISTLHGKRLELTNANLIRSFLSIPFVTLKVITLIHWEAFRLWRKKIPFHRKASHPELQRDVYRPYRPS